jgi:hypothetical protein
MWAAVIMPEVGYISACSEKLPNIMPKVKIMP